MSHTESPPDRRSRIVTAWERFTNRIREIKGRQRQVLDAYDKQLTEKEAEEIRARLNSL